MSCLRHEHLLAGATIKPVWNLAQIPPAFITPLPRGDPAISSHSISVFEKHIMKNNGSKRMYSLVLEPTPEAAQWKNHGRTGQASPSASP